MSADILDGLERFANGGYGDWSTVASKAIARIQLDAAEIVRLRGEVESLLKDPDEAELAYRCGDPDSDAIAPAEAKGEGELPTTDAEVEADNAKAADRARLLAIANGCVWDDAAWVKPPTPQPADGEAVAPFGWVRPSELDKAIRLGEPGARIGVHVSPVRDEECTAPLYTTPPAPVQAAPQEGEQDTSRWPLLDRVEFALRDAGFDYDEAFRIAHMAANPSACELGADGVGEIIARDKRVWALAGLAEKCGAVKDEGESGLFWTLTLGDFYKLEAALQHRGDSQEVGRG